MQRMSRAGRKGEISKVLYQEFKRKEARPLSIGQIAKRMGGKSSSTLRDMAIELHTEDENINMTIADGVRVWWWTPRKQMSLPERFITINGKSHKVANWVSDAREFGGKNV